uniref:AlNc14C38G3297 protein n=1 Tax=Albugo laibachii Nc14 TaxID=890382 RepID=F0W926_9STRA|nr:AlNc14C38G3297 [Albugo laibachii Nc14]|eukprot:CCA17638.1 AlNc14C38G3297 [Albugo laibachii Nc14]
MRPHAAPSTVSSDARESHTFFVVSISFFKKFTTQLSSISMLIMLPSPRMRQFTINATMACVFFPFLFVSQQLLFYSVVTVTPCSAARSRDLCGRRGYRRLIGMVGGEKRNRIL